MKNLGFCMEWCMSIEDSNKFKSMQLQVNHIVVYLYQLPVIKLYLPKFTLIDYKQINITKKCIIFIISCTEIKKCKYCHNSI
jgi:hypothetical protein